MKTKNLKNPLLLLLAAFIWGTAFVAQKEGMNYIGPFTYNGIRSVMGGAVLLLLLPVLDRLRAKNGGFKKGDRRTLLIGGLLCGLALFAGSTLQQFGIQLQDPETNVGKAGFITACYCAIVPVLGLFLKKRSPLLVWLGVLVAVVGFFFLCLMDGLVQGEGLGLGLSDFLVLICAVAFACHILIIAHFTELVDGVRLSCIQFFVAGGISLVGMLLFEKPALPDILQAWLPICYAGILSCAVAYTLQIVGQKGVHPAAASLLLSLESVFSVLAGMVLQGGRLSGWEWLGCVLVFGAVVLVELAPEARKKERLHE